MHGTFVTKVMPGWFGVVGELGGHAVAVVVHAPPSPGWELDVLLIELEFELDPWLELEPRLEDEPLLEPLTYEAEDTAELDDSEPVEPLVEEPSEVADALEGELAPPSAPFSPMLEPVPQAVLATQS